MQNRSNRGSGKPVRVRAHQARAYDWDPAQRIALGPAVMDTASTGRTHDCTQPHCINVEFIPCQMGAVHRCCLCQSLPCQALNRRQRIVPKATSRIYRHTYQMLFLPRLGLLPRIEPCLLRDDVFLDGELNELRVRLNIQLLHNSIFVKGDGSWAYLQNNGGLFHRSPFGE